MGGFRADALGSYSDLAPERDRGRVAAVRHAPRPAELRVTRQLVSRSRTGSSGVGVCRPLVVRIDAAGDVAEPRYRARVALSLVASSCLWHPRVPSLRLSTPTRLTGASSAALVGESAEAVSTWPMTCGGVATDRHKNESNLRRFLRSVKRRVGELAILLDGGNFSQRPRLVLPNGATISLRRVWRLTTS